MCLYHSLLPCSLSLSLSDTLVCAEWWPHWAHHGSAWAAGGLHVTFDLSAAVKTVADQSLSMFTLEVLDKCQVGDAEVCM